MAKTNSKTPKTGKYSRQWARTARNKQKARDLHEKNHPNDKACKADWAKSPVKYGR